MKKLLIVVVIFMLHQYNFALAPKSVFQLEKINECIALDDYTNQDISTIIVFASADICVVSKAFQIFKKITKTKKQINIVFCGGITQETLELYSFQYIKRFSELPNYTFFPELGKHKKFYQGNLKKFEMNSVGIYNATKKYLTSAEIFAQIFLEIAIYSGMSIRQFSIKKNLKEKKYNSGQYNIFLERDSVNISDSCVKAQRLLEQNRIPILDIILINKSLWQLRTYIEFLQNLIYKVEPHGSSPSFIYNATYHEVYGLVELAKELHKIINVSDDVFRDKLNPIIFYYRDLLEIA